MKIAVKRVTAILLSIVLLLAPITLFTGCGEVEDDDRFNEDVDSSKTQLYVGYYNGGHGLNWIKEIKRQFEEKYPEYQIMIDTGKDEYGSSILMSNVKTNRQDMYLTDGTSYYEFIQEGLMMDLTEAMTTPLTEYGEDRSIVDKMNVSLKNYLETSDGKFYAAPYYQSYHHLIYDVDLFDQYSLWFKDGGGFVSSVNDKKSAGQDGEYGTWDDGLPVTYSDFFLMMDRMVSRGITPVTWTGTYADAYLTNFIHSLIADYEGEDFATNFCYDGQIDIITNKNFTESDPNTFELSASDHEKVTVTPENFKEYMHSTTGKYFATKFAKDLATNPQYRTYNYAESHTAVQRSYLMSSMEGVDKPIAMLIEGDWWMNEARSVFSEMAEIDAKYSMENRRFGVMPIPKADDGSSAEGHTVASFSGESSVFISAFSSKQDIAVKFFRFLHTDDAMRVYTLYSGGIRPYDYDLTPIMDQLPYYARNFAEMAQNTNFIFKVTTGKYKEDMVVKNFMQYGGLLRTHIREATTNNPIIFFCDNSWATAKDYLLGLQSEFNATMPVNLR